MKVASAVTPAISEAMDAMAPPAAAATRFNRRDQLDHTLNPSKFIETVEVGKAMIKQRTISEISPMPTGLLNSLKAEQILDLLAWFETMK
jgi:hypothetical protein